jgi:Mor family transcriptional regulator
MTDKFTWEAAQSSVAQRLQRSYGWDEERATQAAEIVVNQLRKDFGGKRHYLPGKNGQFRERIRAEFNGRNIVELSRIYGVSARTVRRYVAKK